jgi:hypothetical protein
MADPADDSDEKGCGQLASVQVARMPLESDLLKAEILACASPNKLLRDIVSGGWLPIDIRATQVDEKVRRPTCEVYIYLVGELFVNFTFLSVKILYIYKNLFQKDSDGMSHAAKFRAIQI